MTKPNRNDLCPCGSGKKFKNCCGANEDTATNPNTINHKLNQLHQQLISYASSKHEKQINEQIEIHADDKIKQESETKDIYFTGLYIWILLNVPFLKQNQTVFDMFYNQNAGKIIPDVRKIFRSWQNQLPSVYEVVSDSANMLNVITIEDIRSKQTFKIPLPNGESFHKGTLLVGTLVPFAYIHNFFFTMIKLYKHTKEELIEIIQNYTDEDGTLNKQFPEFLSKVLIGSEESEDTNPLYGKVSQLLANHLVDKNVSDDIIFEAVKLWNSFCEAEQPNFKAIEPFAAALEYYIQLNYLKNESVTQGQLAEEYGTSASSISAKYRNLQEVLQKKSS